MSGRNFSFQIKHHKSNLDELHVKISPPNPKLEKHEHPIYSNPNQTAQEESQSYAVVEVPLKGWLSETVEIENRNPHCNQIFLSWPHIENLSSRFHLQSSQYHEIIQDQM